MVRRKSDKKWRPPFERPKGIVLLATPEGWRHSILDVKGAMICGRLPGVPADADPREAKTAAAAMVVGLAREFHEADVEVTWDPPTEPRSWTGHVTLAAEADTTPPDA